MITVLFFLLHVAALAAMFRCGWIARRMHDIRNRPEFVGGPADGKRLCCDHITPIVFPVPTTDGVHVYVREKRGKQTVLVYRASKGVKFDIGGTP